MEKSKEEFTCFIHDAANDANSDARQELYYLLVNCFCRADVHKQGKVRADSFDTLVEEAVTLPRVHGYAPQTNVLYPTLAERKSARAKLFAAIDTDGDGNITLEEWVKYASKHILEKERTLPADPLSTDRNVTKDDFIRFIKKAVDKGTAEYRQLYFFLLKCFTEADRDRDGAVNYTEFDAMIEIAAGAPRRFGLAPNSSSIYKTDADRLASRKKEFDRMDTNKNGLISFDEWLTYAYDHILKKASAI